MAEELAERKRELTKAKDKSAATVRVASALERAKEAAEAESRKASAALEKLKGERAATLLRSQKAEIKANEADSKREALRTATEEMLSLLSQMNPGLHQLTVVTRDQTMMMMRVWTITSEMVAETRDL